MNISRVLRNLAFPLFVFGTASLAHAQGGSCKDPWINQAYNKLYHRAPSGSGLSGECDVRLYGGGSWSNYDDLERKIIIAKGGGHAAAMAPAAPVGMHLDRGGNVYNGSVLVARAGTFDLVSRTGSLLNTAAIVAQGGGNIVAQGGGNIVAQGGGNIVAQGGGNMRSVQSVESRPKFVLQ